MVEEAKLIETEGGLEPEGAGYHGEDAQENFLVLSGECLTRDPEAAYKGLPRDEPVGYRDGWL